MYSKCSNEITRSAIWRQHTRQNFIILNCILSACPAYSVPVDFASEKSYPLYFVDEKALVDMYENWGILLNFLLYFFATRRNDFSRPRGDFRP